MEEAVWIALISRLIGHIQRGLTNKIRALFIAQIAGLVSRLFVSCSCRTSSGLSLTFDVFDELLLFVVVFVVDVDVVCVLLSLACRDITAVVAV